MAQQANVNTLKKYYKNFAVINSTKQTIIRSRLFLSSFSRMLAYRGAWIVRANAQLNAGRVALYLHVFLRSATALRALSQLRLGSDLSYVNDFKEKSAFRKHLWESKRAIQVPQATALSEIFARPFLLPGVKGGVCFFRILNKVLASKNVRRWRRKLVILLRRYRSNLFTRRLFLYVDFIKIVTLVLHNKVSTAFFLKILCEIFRPLPKRKHATFLAFVKYTFKQLLRAGWNFSGLKLRINGKLRGKTRSGSFCLILGTIPVQTYSKKIWFTKRHVYTVYGAFGFKLWAYEKSPKQQKAISTRTLFALQKKKKIFYRR